MARLRQALAIGAGFASVVVGCATVPSVPSVPPVTTAASPVPSVAPSIAPSPYLPPNSPEPCVPERVAYVPIFEEPSAGRGAYGRGWVVLARCESRYLQRVGQSPMPLEYLSGPVRLEWLAPDGSFALITTSRVNEQSKLVRRWANGSADELLHQGPFGSLAVAPDGRTIAWVSSQPVDEQTSKSELHLLQSDSGERRTLPVGGGYQFWLKWSPDSRKLLYLDRDPDETWDRLNWTSWDDLVRHRFEGEVQGRYDSIRGQISWAPDSRHVLIYDQNPMIPNKTAVLLTLDLEGSLVAEKPIVGPDGRPETWFNPREVQADNPLVVGYQSILDTRTGMVYPAGEGAVGWSSKPGELLRWRLTSEGPQLDTVPFKAAAP
jgi:WD40-like Beta Propeller Repeat